MTDLLVQAEELRALLNQAQVLPVDCRFDFTNTQAGREMWLEGHIPGAAYAHLDEDLSSPVTPESGRHPLPDPDRFMAWLASIGWTPATVLVAYDDRTSMIAARLWWMMRWIGFDARILDGGLGAWVNAGYGLESGENSLEPAPISPYELAPSRLVETEEVLANLESRNFSVVDARAAERFSGSIEPLDTRAGHIPGAFNHPFTENLGAGGKFLAPEQLKRLWNERLGGRDPETVAHSCGSGVTACHNLLAMELAGLSGSKLYAGSWSEWIRDENRPIATSC